MYHLKFRTYNRKQINLVVNSNILPREGERLVIHTNRKYTGRVMMVEHVVTESGSSITVYVAE